MTTQFTYFRLSFIWVETIPAILEQRLDTKNPYAFLGKPGQFAKTFDELKAGGKVGDLQLPWPYPRGHHFWKHYFGGRHAGDISGADAWKLRVPLRSKDAVGVALEAAPAGPPSSLKVTFEAFYAPHGLCFVANAYYRGDARSLDKVAAIAHDVRYRSLFRSSADGKKGGMSLEKAKDHALERARYQAFGAAPAFPGFNQPFTIATFVQGEADNQIVAKGSPEHRALEALTEWEDYASVDLSETPLKKLEPISKQGMDDLVYASDRGRAIWLPRQFGRPAPAAGQEKDPAYHRLSAYHRNLTLASLQTMSLGEGVAFVSRAIQRGEKVHPLLLARARESARVLDDLALGERTQTYRSMSVAKQVEAASWRLSIKTVLESA